MAGFKRSILVQKPVKEVFDFATNLDNAPLFMVGLTKVELLTEGGIKHGARFRSTRAFKGKERSAILEVVEYERPRVYATRSAMMGLKGIMPFILPKKAQLRESSLSPTLVEISVGGVFSEW